MVLLAKVAEPTKGKVEKKCRKQKKEFLCKSQKLALICKFLL